MGHNQSKQKHPTKHVLGGGQPRQQPQQTQQPKPQGGKNVLGGGSSEPGASQQQASRGTGDPRSAAAEAAERRLKAEQARGTNASNPNAGKLAAQVTRSNAKAAVPQPSNQKDNLVWD